MPLLELQGLADPIARRDFDALNRFSERGFYQPAWSEIVGSSGGGGGTATLARFQDMAAWTLPAAGVPVLTATFGLPPLWVTGKVGIALVYSGAASTTNGIALSWNIAPAALGSIPGTGTLAGASVPGPGTANALAAYSIAPTVSVSAEHSVLQFKLFRVSPDAYAADVYIVAITPIWYPERQ